MLGEICDWPSAIETFKQNGRLARDGVQERTPLIVEAEAFARHLDPPKSAEKLPASPTMTTSTPVLPPGRPVAPSVSFRLRATSCYPNRPGRSMALVAEIGIGEGAERWVREGTQVGHFVIQEIRRGSITYRDGDQVREMAVEQASSPRSLVRDIRPESRQVGAAAWAAADTNSIEIGGN
jgi:hypothetical protein